MSSATPPPYTWSRSAPRRGGLRLLQRDPQVLIVQIATLAGVLLTGGGLILLVMRELPDLLILAALLPAGVAALVFTVRRLAEAEDREFLMRVMVAGLLVRLGLAMVVHYALPVWFFAPDQVTYQDVGWRTLQYHQGLGPIPWQIQNTTEVGYFYWNAFLYWIFGFAPLAPKVANCVFGTAASVLAYRMAGELAGRDTARFAALLTMFFPSLVLWSTLNLRDPVVLLITMGLFLAAVRLRKHTSGRSIFAILLGLGLLLLFRDYIAVMALFGLVGSTFLSRGRGLPANLLIGAILFGLAVLAYQQFNLGARWVESASIEAIAQQREFMAVGGTAFRPDAQFSSPLQGLQFLPVGLAFFLFSPFPWQVGSALSLMTLPEQVVWYGLLPMVVMGGLYVVRHRFHVFGPVLVFVALTTCVYALVEGNAGTAYRHRAQVLVFFLILAAVGLALRKARKARDPTADAGP